MLGVSQGGVWFLVSVTDVGEACSRPPYPPRQPSPMSPQPGHVFPATLTVGYGIHSQFPAEAIDCISAKTKSGKLGSLSLNKYWLNKTHEVKSVTEIRFLNLRNFFEIIF